MESATPLTSARNMSFTQRKNIALRTIRRDKAITRIAQDNSTSRQFVYRQQSKAIEGIDQAFSPLQKDDEKVLFLLPITKTWLCQLILCLILHCRGSFRGITKLLDDVFDYPISIGTIYNITQEAKQKAQSINAAQDLSRVTLGAHDELFHLNKPVLAGIDIPSLYCYLLSQEQQRDADTWAIHLWDLEKQGFNPDRTIADDGDGLRAGQKLALPHVPCDGDNFHITKTLIELRRYFRNRLKTAVTYHVSLEEKMEKARQHGKYQHYTHKLGIARRKESQMRYLSKTIDILVSWMEHDILNKAGPNPEERGELFDFVVEEFQKLEASHPHRIKSVRSSLQNQKNQLLAFTDVLDRKFQSIGDQFSCSLDTVWKVCELQRCEYLGDTYAIRQIPLLSALKDLFDPIEDAVLHALDTTERTSSMVENLNSRLRPYFFLRREIGFGYLDLLRFYLNHTPFLRSERLTRVGKTPTEFLTGKPHQHWLEMLGFERFKRAA